MPMLNGAVKSDVQPLYFGSTSKRLFGCYQEPAEGGRGVGVVLCQPLWREYIRSHRAFRQLAVRLSDQGFAVLRFDYYGCGDSHGDDDEGDLRQWTDDVSTAIDELRRRSGVSRVDLAGLRMGAALSMFAADERDDVGRTVMWEPIVSGRQYVDEMRSVHAERLGGLDVNADGDEGRATELLGVRLSESRLAELYGIDLLDTVAAPSGKTLIVETTGHAAELRDHLVGLSADVSYRHVPGPQIWRDDETALIPGATLDAIVSWLCGEST